MPLPKSAMGCPMDDAAARADGPVDDVHPVGAADQRADPVRRDQAPGRGHLGQGPDRAPAHARGRRDHRAALRPDHPAAGDLRDGAARARARADPRPDERAARRWMEADGAPASATEYGSTSAPAKPRETVDADYVATRPNANGPAFPPGRFRRRRWLAGSARVELDDQVRLHLHRVGHVGELRRAHERARACALVVDLDDSPARRARRCCVASSTSASCFDFSSTSIVSPSLHLVGGDVDPLAVDRTWPWLTNWRAANGVGANFIR